MPAFAVTSGAARLGIRRANVSRAPIGPVLAFQDGGRPRWVKWGLIGAVAGAATFALLSQSADDPNPVLQDAAVGAVVGFVTIGGAVAFYDWVCKPDSSSERAGLC